MKDYTKELGSPESWSEEDKAQLVALFRKVPQMTQLSDKDILKIAAEHWKFQNGEDIEDTVTLDELERAIKRPRRASRHSNKGTPKI